MEQELSYEEWAGKLTPADLEGKGTGQSLTKEELAKAIETLKNAPKGKYICSPNLSSN